MVPVLRGYVPVARVTNHFKRLGTLGVRRFMLEVWVEAGNLITIANIPDVLSIDAVSKLIGRYNTRIPTRPTK